MKNKYEVISIKTCKHRKYIENKIERWAKGFCDLDNKKCPCIMPPSNEESARSYGCNKKYESHTNHNIWFD